MPSTKKTTLIQSKPTGKNRKDVSVDSEWEDVERDQTMWPQDARLVGTKKLTKQNIFLRALVGRAIFPGETEVVTKHAWPEPNRSAEHRADLLIDALRELRPTDRAYSGIRKRLKKDSHFGRVLGRWVSSNMVNSHSL